MFKKLGLHANGSVGRILFFNPASKINWECRLKISRKKISGKDLTFLIAETIPLNKQNKMPRHHHNLP